jgi:hypothetical protein
MSSQLGITISSIDGWATTPWKASLYGGTTDEKQ